MIPEHTASALLVGPNTSHQSVIWSVRIAVSVNAVKSVKALPPPPPAPHSQTALVPLTLEIFKTSSAVPID